MKRLLNILFGSLQAILLTFAVSLSVLMGTLYVVVHSRLAGWAVEHSISHLLAEQIGTTVTVDDDVEVSWNNQLVLNHLTIYDQKDVPMISARRVMVAFELWPLLKNHLILNTCQLIDFDIRTYRASSDSLMNYQFLIDAINQKRDPDSKPFIENFDLNFIILRQGSLSYNVLDKPKISNSPIDPNHVEISKLSANVHVHDKELLIRKLHCQEHQYSYRAERIKLALNFAEVLHSPAGEHRLLLVANGLEASGDDLVVRADISGDSDTVEIALHELSLPFGHPRLNKVQELRAKANIVLSQLTNPIDSIYFATQIQNLTMRIERVGELQLSGSAEGTTHVMETNFSLKNEFGDAGIAANILRKDNDNLKISGCISSNGINLAEILPRNLKLGFVAANIDFAFEQNNIHGRKVGISGRVNQLEWREHNYRDITIDGIGNQKAIEGNIAMRDSLGDLDADISLDLSGKKKHLVIDGQAKHLNPNALKLSQVSQFDSISISGEMHAEIQADKLSDLVANVKIKDVKLEKGNRTEKLGDFDFEGTPHNGRLESEITKLRYYRRRGNGQYSVQGNIAPVNNLLSLLSIPVVMSNDVRFEARIDSAYHINHAYLRIPEIEVNNGNFLSATWTVRDSANLFLRNILELQARNEKHHLKGTLMGKLSQHPLAFAIDPSTFTYNDETVQLDSAKLVRTSDGDFFVDNIHLRGGQQEISASGVMNNKGDKDFVLRLKNFDLDQIFSTIDRGYVHFGGRATGDIVLRSNPELTLSADSLKIRYFSYIDTLLGNASINLAYNIPKHYINVDCDIETPTKHISHAECEVNMDETTKLDLRVNSNHLPLGFINYWTGGILQRFSGTVTGDVRLYGATSELQLAGTPYVDGRFTHDILGTYFHIADTVKLSHNLLKLDHASVDDCHGHPLTLDATVTHNCLRNFGYDVKLDLPNAQQGFLVMDRPKAPGRLYWGQLYAKGKAQLTGGNGKHRIDVDVATTDKSWLFVSPRAQDLNPDQEAYSFLTFRDKSKIAEFAQLALQGDTVQTSITMPENEVSHTDLEVKLIANATDQCEVTVQMDPSSEDLLTSRGEGTLTIIYNPQRDLTLSGEYHINQGTYTMNINPDIINKRFQLQNTSMVSFNGVPSEANLRLDATYTIPSVNLSDLGEQVAAMKSLSRTTVPVDCKMNVSGQLASPQIEFDLEVKNGNKEVDDLVHNAIGTPEMINQQVLYLLIFSKFYPPQDVQSNNQMRAGAELSSLASASVASQLNQLLNRLSDNLTLGTSFKSDRGDFSDMEMDLSLSTRLLNDRLLLYGNLGYRDPANRIGAMGNSSSFIGDFDIEYIINRARTIRAKVYSHYNERDYSINNALTTQGVGLIIRHDFDTFKNIWQYQNWFRKKNQKSQSEEPEVSNNTQE